MSDLPAVVTLSALPAPVRWVLELCFIGATLWLLFRTVRRLAPPPPRGRLLEDMNRSATRRLRRIVRERLAEETRRGARRLA